MPEPKRRASRIGRKHVGLTPPKKLVDDETLRSLPQGVAGPDESAVSASQPGAAAEPRRPVFGTAHHLDGDGQQPATQPSPVPNAPGRAGVADDDFKLSQLLRRILNEVAAPDHQEDGSTMRNAEVLTRKLVEKALEGNQFAMETVLDRVEGKPQRANQPQGTDTTIEEQIERSQVDLLNSLTKDAP